MILEIDPGQRRVGVAAADEDTRFARPVEVIDTRVADPIERIASLVEEMDARSVVVGRPVGLSGRSGPSVARQSEFVAALRTALEVDVVEHDERLTTVAAEAGMRASGASRAAIKARGDAVAAQLMLQGYLDSIDSAGYS